MSENKLVLTPDTKIFDLLQAYPEAEDKLIEIAPVFKKLKNPMLRKTITKITSLQQAALVGGVPIERIINELRELIGHDKFCNDGSKSTASDGNTPDWFDTEKITKSLDAREIIASGGHPLDKVVKDVGTMASGDIYELVTPFFPAPLVDVVKGMGFNSWTDKSEADLFKTYFCKD